MVHLEVKLVFKIGFYPKFAQKIKDSVQKTWAANNPNKSEYLVKSMADLLKAIIKRKMEIQGTDYVF